MMLPLYLSQSTQRTQRKGNLFFCRSAENLFQPDGRRKPHALRGVVYGQVDVQPSTLLNEDLAVFRDGLCPEGCCFLLPVLSTGSKKSKFNLSDPCLSAIAGPPAGGQATEGGLKRP